MKTILLCVLLSSAVGASQCSPKKSNPKNEQCAKDLLKDGIGNLPADLQNQMMEPLVNNLAKKLMKDMLKDSECDQDKPQQCPNTPDLEEIANPFSDEGKKMFDKAGKDLNESGDQLKNEANKKIGEMGKDLKNQVTEEAKNFLGDMGLPAGDVQDLMGNATNVIGDAMGGMQNQFGWKIGNSTGNAGKKLGGLAKKVAEMPKAGLDFINKQLKDKRGDLLNKTLASAKGEIKGLVSGFLGAIGLDGLKNITGGGLDSKMKWLKNKLNSIVGDHSAQFGIESKAMTEGVFDDFVSTMPAEFQVVEDISLTDIGLILAHGHEELRELMRDKTEVKEDAFHNMTDTMEVDSEEEVPDITVDEESAASTTAWWHTLTTNAPSTTTHPGFTTTEGPTTTDPTITTMDLERTTTYIPTTTDHYTTGAPNTTAQQYNVTRTTTIASTTTTQSDSDTTTTHPDITTASATTYYPNGPTTPRGPAEETEETIID